MFESEESIVQALIASNDEFKALYKRHNELKRTVGKADMGNLAVGDDALNSMKREKLLTKDRMTAMVDEFRRQQAT